MELTAEDERRKKSLPSQADWRPRNPTHCLILHLLRHKATPVPRAHDGSVSIGIALMLMPKPFNDFQRLLGVMRPGTEHDQPTMFIALRDRAVGYNTFRIADIQGHSVPFAHPER